MTDILQIDRALDASHPVLADHQPGGLPLLGTAMSIQLLAEACLSLRPGATVRAIENVEARRPWIAQPGAPPNVRVRLEPIGREPAGARFRGSLVSGADNDNAGVHLVAELTLDDRGSRDGLTLRPDDAVASADRLDALLEGGVEASRIYEVYFHGPAFRLLDKARRRDRRVIARLSANIETLAIPELARGIEFAMQTAGLLELSTREAMLIPHAIGRIRLGPKLAPASGAVGYATARYIDPDDLNAGMNIDFAGADGAVAVRVEGYRTVELPFPGDRTAQVALARLL